MALQEQEIQKALGSLTTGMAGDDLRRLGYLMCVFELKRGDVLVREGQHTGSLYIVQHGALRISVGAEPNVVELPEINSGHWVGEVSLLDPGPASATVSVLRKTTTVLEFSHEALKDYVRSHPAGAAVLLEALASALADRLHQTSDGIVRNRDGQLIQGEMPPPAEATSWFRKVVSVLGRQESLALPTTLTGFARFLYSKVSMTHNLGCLPVRLSFRKNRTGMFSARRVGRAAGIRIAFTSFSPVRLLSARAHVLTAGFQSSAP